MFKHTSQLSYRVPYLRTASNSFILSYSGPFLEKFFLRKYQYSYMNILMIKHTLQLSYRVPYLRIASNRFILSYSGPFLEKKYLRKYQYSYINISMIKHISQLSYRDRIFVQLQIVSYCRTVDLFLRKNIYGNTNIATLIFQ